MQKISLFTALSSDLCTVTVCRVFHNDSNKTLWPRKLRTGLCSPGTDDVSYAVESINGHMLLEIHRSLPGITATYNIVLFRLLFRNFPKTVSLSTNNKCIHSSQENFVIVGILFIYFYLFFENNEPYVNLLYIKS